MHRLIVFLEDMSGMAPTLFARATLQIVRQRTDVKVAAVCIRHPKPYWRLLRRHLLHRIRNRFRTQRPPPLNLTRLSRQDGFRVITPFENDFNHPKFLTELEERIRPTMAISFLCEQRFGGALLKTLRYPVNYHNGALPMYRGLFATSWSLYRGDRQSGFTFHLMNERFDEGPILWQGSVPVEEHEAVWDVEWRKTTAACAALPRLLDLMANGVAGIPQEGKGCYYSYQDFLRICTIPDPTELTSIDITRRLRAFGSLRMQIKGRWFLVSELKETAPFHPKESMFQTADGHLLVTRMRPCDT